MSKKTTRSSGRQPLRTQAGQQVAIQGKRDVAQMSTSDIAELIHELDTHQIELEMQNEELRRIQGELQEARNCYSDFFDFAPVGYLSLNSNGLIIEANLTCAEMLDVDKLLLIGKPFSAFISVETQDSFRLFKSAILTTNISQTCELALRNVDDANAETKDCVWVRVDGRPILDENGKMQQIHLFLCNITSQRRDQALLQHQAFYDQLTKLPNRYLFVDRLGKCLACQRRSPFCGALFYIDLDNFKLINDSLGHSTGDLVLQHVANVLTKNIRADDTAARFGGDEFVLLLNNLAFNEDAAAIQAQTVAGNIIGALSKPWRLEDFYLQIEVSIGITLFSKGVCSVDEIISCADLSMYQAKNKGKNAVEFYQNDMHVQVKERLETIQDLRHALAVQEFYLVYQPQVDLNQQMTGAECLLRWRHPSKGKIMPGEFISVLEDSSLIIDVGTWVLTEACNKIVQWQRMGEAFSKLSLAVNVSAKQFNRVDFFLRVKDILEKTGANPRNLVLEITENMLLTDTEAVIVKMNRLKQIGISFSIDDFGTGYSSLSYIKRLPLDALKIDQSFVRDMHIDKDNEMLVDAVLSIANHLNLKVIAEGAEIEEERALLIEKGCLYFQGFIFSRPLDCDAFEEFVLSKSKH